MSIVFWGILLLTSNLRNLSDASLGQVIQASQSKCCLPWVGHVIQDRPPRLNPRVLLELLERGALFAGAANV